LTPPQDVKRAHSQANLAADEIGAVRKEWRGRTRVALVYPNHYHVGMSNLGLQTV
jgi:hypothetical protein